MTHDYSIADRKIRQKVMNMCLEAIVSHAFIGSLPISDDDLDTDLTQGLASYASECLQDLGGMQLLEEAMENATSPAKKAYLNQIKRICMETANDVTSRIIAEAGDEDLEKAVKNVTMTPEEYRKFASNAAAITPESLTKMIQKKTLDTIKEEKEAYRKDAELETELMNALNEVSDEDPTGMSDDAPVPGEPTGNDGPDANVPDAMSQQPNAELGEEIGQSEDNTGMESMREDIESEAKNLHYTVIDSEAQAKAILAASQTDGEVKDADGVPILVINGKVNFLGRDAEGKIHMVPMDTDDAKAIANESEDPIDANTSPNTPNNPTFTQSQNAVGKDKEKQEEIGEKIGTSANDCPVCQTAEAKADPVKQAVDHKPVPQVGMQGAVDTAKGSSDMYKVQESFKSYMESMAGKNYRAKHTTIFSRIQEIATEAVMTTSEIYGQLPLDTMKDITIHDTFSRFNSFNDRTFDKTMESIIRFTAMESEGIDRPSQEEQMNMGLLVASIIYTFFETLNSMNLYCPKLNEIKRFVEETIPVEKRIKLDQRGFMDLFNSMIAEARANVLKATTTNELDDVEKKLDIVREKTAAPGFEADKEKIGQQISGLKTTIAEKRNAINARLQSKRGPAQESYTQMMQRNRDTMKFSRIANLMGRKSVVHSIKCKIDPQQKSNYVAIEAYTKDNKLQGTNVVVLESSIATQDLPGYVQAAVEGSKLMDLDKGISIVDSRNGKTYYSK